MLHCVYANKWVYKILFAFLLFFITLITEAASVTKMTAFFLAQTLHPLLETSSLDDNEDISKKIAFIGLSNWALDPAKMNRGIMLSREDLTKDDLIDTARYIKINCS